MDYEQALVRVGQMGRYQVVFYCLIVLAYSNCGIHIFNVVFTMGMPQFRCAVPGLQNDTFTIQNEAHAQLVQAAIPYDPDKGGYSKCSRYKTGLDQMVAREVTNVTSLETEACTRWVYSNEGFASSIVKDLDLVCDRQIYTSHSNMLGMLGIMMICIVSGPLSDRFGRKKLFVLLMWLQLSASVAVVFVRSEVEFLVLRFLEVGASMASLVSLYGIVTEISAPSARLWSNCISHSGFNVGLMFVIFVAYFVRDWRTLHLILTIPLAITAIFYPIVIPESPKWLLVRKRYGEVKVILRTIGSVNGKPLCGEIYLSQSESEKNQNTNGFLTGLRLLFGSRVLAFRLIILAFGWAINSMVYYGIGLNLGLMIPGNIYINFLVLNLSTLLALPPAVKLLVARGRKLTVCLCMMLGGAFCIAAAFPFWGTRNVSWVTTVLSNLGKVLLFISFVTIWLYTTELIPTRARLSGLGFCNLIGRAGSMISPYIATLPTVVEGKLGQALPLLVFGICGLVSGTLCLLLPETGNGKLPDTVREAEMMKWRKPPKDELEEKTTHNPLDSAIVEDETL